MNQLRYFAGEVVDCDVELAELAPAPAQAEVTVRLRLVHGDPPPLTDYEQGSGFDDDGGLTFRVPPVATVRMVPGWHDVEIFRDAKAPESALSHIILDHVLPRRLALAGRITLHGTCVSVGGRALGFVGHTHQGKSTLSAALAQRGGLWLADDCLVVDQSIADDGSTSWVVVPTFAGTRLWPDSSAAIGLAASDGETIDERISKLRWSDAAGEVADSAVPLAGLMVVERGEPDISPSLDRLSAGEALKVLGAHWFLAYAQSPKEFLGKAARLLGSVPVYRLSVPGSLQRLDEVLDALSAHFVTLAASTTGRG